MASIPALASQMPLLSESQSRPRYKFPREIWRDRLATIPFDQNKLEWYDGEVNVLKIKVDALLKDACSDAMERIKLIDLLCRLGISYHYEAKIERQLHQIFHSNLDFLGKKDYDLYSIAVVFRVFRQHGIQMSCDVFNKFMNAENGKFKDSIADDPRGLLSLFEASHLSTHEEHILEEALSFTRTHLEQLAPKLEPNLAKHIASSLRIPLHMGPPRLKAREFISFYEEDAYLPPSEILLRFAKLDFNRVQLLHQEELKNIFQWQKELDLASKLPYARDRIMEYFQWSASAYFEPKYAYSRAEYVKQCNLFTFLDDTYDSYGTLEELQILTDAFERWDRAIIDELPKDYMKHLYKAFLDTFDELEKHAAQDGTSIAISMTRQYTVEIVKCYLIESQWCKRGYNPSFEESMEMGVTTAGAYYMNALAFMVMGGNLTLQAFQWLLTKPDMARASGLFARLGDDVASYERERECGSVNCPLLCYQRENNLSDEETVVEFRRRMCGAWKTLNEELMRHSNTVPLEILGRVLNFARAMHLNYKYGDAPTDGKIIEGYIKTLFIDQIPI